MYTERATLISIARLHIAPGWSLMEGKHPYHELLIVVSGQLHVKIHGRQVVASTGESLFYHRDTQHTEWSEHDKPTVMYGLAFHCPTGPKKLPVHTVDRSGRMRRLAEWLTEEANWPHGTPTHAGRSFLQSLLAEWLRLTETTEHELVTRTRRYVREHVEAHIELADLAELNSLSKYHFLRLYRKLTGTTPARDLMRLRAEHARHLVISTDLPLKAIAPQSGLADEYHLCHVFKKHFGITPGDARRGITALPPNLPT